jgi:hypothetical protein
MENSNDQGRTTGWTFGGGVKRRLATHSSLRQIMVGVLGLCSVAGLASPRAEVSKISVTVADRDSKPVAGLGAGDFVVRAGDHDVRVVDVAPSSGPLAVMFVVDSLNANQIAPMLAAIRSGVDLLRQHEPRSRVGVVRDTVDTTAASMSSVTSDAAISGRIVAAPPMPESIVFAAQALGRESASRRVVLVFRSGRSVIRLSGDRTREVLQETGAELWDIDIDSTPTEPAVADHDQTAINESEAFLTAAVQDSGGLRDRVLGTSGLKERVEGIITLLLSQYVLSCEAPAASSGSTPLQVTMKRAGLRVTAARWVPALVK